MDEWEAARRRGEIDSELRTLKEDVRDMKAENRALVTDLGELKLIVKGLSTKMTYYAALGAFAGGGAMSILVGFFLRR